MLDLCADRTDGELDRAFDMGLGSLRATMAHIVGVMELWTDLMRSMPIRPEGGDTIGALRRRLDTVAGELAETARDVRPRGAWDDTFLDPRHDPPRAKSLGGAIVHVVTHSMHHRAQALWMLRRLGVDELPEGDALGWERSLNG